MVYTHKEGLIMTTVHKTIDDDFDNGFVRIKFEPTTGIFFEDVYHKAYIEGKGMLRYFEKQNYYVFHEFFCFTPTVEAILKKIQGLRLGINHHRTTDAYVLKALLNALSNFWH